MLHLAVHLSKQKAAVWAQDISCPFFFWAKCIYRKYKKIIMEMSEEPEKRKAIRKLSENRTSINETQAREKYFENLVMIVK